MAKFVHSDVLDAAFNLIKNNANIMTLCSAQPTTRAEAITDFALADVAMTTGDFVVSGSPQRLIAVAAKSAVPIDVSGNATHVALCDGTRLLFVTTCTLQALTTGGTVDIPAWTDTIGQPA